MKHFYWEEYEQKFIKIFKRLADFNFKGKARLFMKFPYKRIVKEITMANYLIEKINISGFRKLNSTRLTMKPLMVLIGANGVGKTSFLDALILLSASAAGKLGSTLSQWGGITSILSRDKKQDISLSVDMKIPNQNPLTYNLSIGPDNTGYTILKEELSQFQGQGYANPIKHISSSQHSISYYDTTQKRLSKPTWEHNYLETSLSQTPRMYREPEEIRRILAKTDKYHVLDVSSRAPVKLPQEMKPAFLPGKDGEDLIPFLYYLRESDPDRFETITDTLKTAFHDFENLNFPPVAAGMLTMTWQEKNYKKPFYMHELSEGTLRFLWLVSLLSSPKLSTITMIDEPEVSLHPELLSLLVDVMRETSRRTQLVVATHSDRLVRFLRPEEVVVMDVDEEGAANATWADQMDLDSWLLDYSLDEVWQMGRMGGRA